MTRKLESPGAVILARWEQLRKIPLGPWLFSRLVGRMVPYTASIRSVVQILRPGYAQVLLEDRRRLRNHLGSIHAVALVNLGEFTSGLAFMTGLPPEFRAIVTELTARYLKKARGPLTARSSFDAAGITADSQHVTTAEIVDREGEVVATIAVTWNVRFAAGGDRAEGGVVSARAVH